ncbi:MAG: outer membrane beta-barrel protein [Thermoguttaceae bacterium]
MASKIVVVLQTAFLGALVAVPGAASDDIDVGGWLSTGAYANAWGTAENGTVGGKRIGNGYTVEQMWAYAEKALDTEGGGWDLGGRIDGLFGVDAPATQAFGDGSWDARWDTSDDYGWALPQVYGEVGWGDVSVKAGRFLTILGWECVDDPPNFFSSNSYAYYFGEPATHTGALASWVARDSLTFHGGWTNGWDAGFTDNGGASTFLGGVTWSGLERLTATYNCSAGRLPEGQGQLYMHSLMLEITATERLTWILHNDLGVQPDGPAGCEAFWVGVVQYLQYDLTETLAAGLRLEWFHDRDGTRVAPELAGGNFYELTAGLNWRPREWLIVRPEVRYDRFAGSCEPGSLPFDDGEAKYQFSGGFDLIATF